MKGSLKAAGSQLGRGCESIGTSAGSAHAREAGERKGALCCRALARQAAGGAGCRLMFKSANRCQAARLPG